MTDQTQLAPMERAKLAMKSNDKALLELAAKSKVVTKVESTSEREEAHNFLMTLRKTRVDIEKIGKEVRDDATKYAKAVIEEEKRLIGLISPEEERLRALRDDFDAKLQAERERAAREEQERVEAMERKMAALEHGLQFGDSSDRIRVRLQEVLDIVVDESYGHLEAAAKAKRLDTISTLESALEHAITAEKAAEENARMKAEAEARAAADAEAQAKRDAEERERLAVERKALEEEQARVAAERQALEQAKAEQERQRVEAEAEAKRLASAPDREKLFKFAEDLCKVQPPELETDEAQQIVNGASEALTKLAERIFAAAGKLGE
jgi:hypothetical protein